MGFVFQIIYSDLFEPQVRTFSHSLSMIPGLDMLLQSQTKSCFPASLSNSCPFLILQTESLPLNSSLQPQLTRGEIVCVPPACLIPQEHFWIPQSWIHSLSRNPFCGLEWSQILLGLWMLFVIQAVPSQSVLCWSGSCSAHQCPPAVPGLGMPLLCLPYTTR